MTILYILSFIVAVIVSFTWGYNTARFENKHDLIELLPITNGEKESIRNKLK